MSADAVAWVRAHHRHQELPVGLRRLNGGNNNAVYAAGDLCVKLYKIDDRRRWEPEWRALTFLSQAGLAIGPRPLWYDPDGSPPAVAMELLPGRSLHELSIGVAELGALGEALKTLHHAPGFTAYPTTVIGTPAMFVEQVALAAQRLLQVEDDPLARESADCLREWLTRGDRDLLAQPAPLVFSRGDSFLANCLWDSKSIRFVDFEYAGRSDLAVDLGDLVEGTHAQRVPEHDWASFLDRFELDTAGQQRFMAARRLVAHVWLAIFWRPAWNRPVERILQQLRRIEHVMELPG